MNERWLETRRGARVRVLEGGPPDGPPLVFLHGLTGLLDDTSPTFLDLLAERHRVYAPELPSYGDSSGDRTGGPRQSARILHRQCSAAWYRR